MAQSKSQKAHKENANEAKADQPAFDLLAFSRKATEAWDEALPVFQKAWHNFLEKGFTTDNAYDPLELRAAFAAFCDNLIADPDKFGELQVEYWTKVLTLWQRDALRYLGEKLPEGETEKQVSGRNDRRFKDPAWQEHAVFHFLKESYLLSAQWLMRLLSETKGLSPEQRARVEFSFRQMIDASSPSNFFLTNPVVLRETLESNGENLLKGLKNLTEDMREGMLRISKTDYKAFEVGKNIATTKGDVVFQNDLLQLIQYTPTTKQVYKTPLFFVAPWINKYYILDLKPENSIIKWCVDQGYTVFVTSWVNPDPSYAKKSFENYLDEGILEALDAIKKATGEDSTHVVGYCIGGTLLSATLAYLQEKGQENRIKSATFLTTLIDFENAGDLSLFTGDNSLAELERIMAEKGVLDGATLQNTFNILRAGDLIWSFVVNNYLLGKEPFPFDLLYWNDDSTNMPAAMHSFYLRKMYKENQLCKANAIRLHDTPIDVSDIKTPSYFLSCRDDHIAPWVNTYRGYALLDKADTTFTLSASGHVAGVINPPANKKYGYWSSTKSADTAEHWFEKTSYTEGSWWPHWESWLRTRSGEKVEARKAGSGTLKIIEPAPGSYVKKRY
ncbi:MAG: PHA/PHB synthase family protein [Pseudobdellovibrionaceae bacterium]